MVDQALSLRPEERRPLFEEVAGVRRHERRRRKAEEQLVESESNLSRVEDILAELRPQVRRLAAQAEQQASRSTIGEELTAALLLNAHARWHEVSTRASEATTRGERARADVDAAMADLTAAEGVASAVAEALSARARVEAERREGHDLARAALTALQLCDGRLTSELEAIGRDRTRLAGERDGADADAVRQRRALAAPVPSRDAELERASARRNGPRRGPRRTRHVPGGDAGEGRGAGRRSAGRGGPDGRTRDGAPAARASQSGARRGTGRGRRIRRPSRCAGRGADRG